MRNLAVEITARVSGFLKDIDRLMLVRRPGTGAGMAFVVLKLDE
jgi:hypothetical protein